MRTQADTIINRAISAVLPDAAVKRALESADLSGRIILVAAGKAAWQMARAARDTLGTGSKRASSSPSMTMSKVPLRDSFAGRRAIPFRTGIPTLLPGKRWNW